MEPVACCRPDSMYMVEITSEPIDVPAVLAAASSPLAGAVVLFLGTTREWTEGRRTAWLEYECYEAMARQVIGELEAEARARWQLENCEIVHRVGRVNVGEASVAIAVSSPHRQAAFEAGQWLIDRLKVLVPIWKKENWTEGGSEWVHPGLKLS